MIKLQKGDYVRNLTEEQFNEIMEYQTKGYKPYLFSEKDNNAVFEGDFISMFLNNHKCSNELTYEEFKQRAINTFKR